MTRTRFVLVVVGVLVVWSLAVPTGGVSSTSMDRSIDGEVASDDDAYLGLERACSNGTLAVTVTNRFADGIELDVTVAANETTETVDDLDPGESETVTLAVDPGDTVTITADGSGVSVHLTRAAPADC